MKERKYEVLPGVKIPEYKEIVEAASDFSTPGVEDLAIKSQFRVLPDGTHDAATREELESMRQLGEEVAKEETKAQEEARKKMEKIKEKAVTQISMSDLRKAASGRAGPIGWETEKGFQQIEP